MSGSQRSESPGSGGGGVVQKENDDDDHDTYLYGSRRPTAGQRGRVWEGGTPVTTTTTRTGLHKAACCCRGVQKEARTTHPEHHADEILVEYHVLPAARGAERHVLSGAE